jgi:hypothetical protein
MNYDQLRLLVERIRLHYGTQMADRSIVFRDRDRGFELAAIEETQPFGCIWIEDEALRSKPQMKEGPMPWPTEIDLWQWVELQCYGPGRRALRGDV